MPFVAAILDFIYTIYQDVRGDAAKFQYLTPIVVAASMVSHANSRMCTGSVVCVKYISDTAVIDTVVLLCILWLPTMFMGL